MARIPQWTPTIPTFDTARLSEARRFIVGHPRASAGVAALLLVVLVSWFVMDTSAALTGEQAQAVRQFVLRTQSPAVQARFNQAVEDGRLTVHETEAIIEVAKGASPGYGLVSDQHVKE